MLVHKNNIVKGAGQYYKRFVICQIIFAPLNRYYAGGFVDTDNGVSSEGWIRYDLIFIATGFLTGLTELG